MLRQESDAGAEHGAIERALLQGLYDHTFRHLTQI
jgi:hypothetical protein